MNSLGSSATWPSYGLLPSTSSFLFSESEQTEDEGDFFSEGEGDSERTKSLSGDERTTLSGNYFNFPGQSDEQHSRSKSGHSKDCPCETKHPNSASSPGAATLSSLSATPGDLAFAQKCADLHRFIRPLLELLHGLKTGRFDKGLTTFQQSVAIDRLQRILGILQKPEMGEKYLQNLLQIETMLKIWFPQVAFQSTLNTLNQTTTPRLSQNWHKNQLHIPVKKRKLSWSDPEHPGKVPTKCKHHQHGKHGSCQASMSLDTVSTCLPGSPKRRKIPKEEMLESTGKGCAAGHEFTDSTGTLSRLYTERDNENRKQSQISLPSPCDSPATQDSSVSSSDTITTADSP